MKKVILGSVMAVIFTACVSLVCVGNICAVGSNMSPAGTANLNVADISSYQTVTDWTKLASSVDALYIKVSEGSTVTDAKYASYADAAQTAGIKYGFYHYFWAYADVSNAVKQADYFYNLIRGYTYSCLPVLDVEKVDTGVTKAQVTADVKAFATEFKRLSGQDIMIYTSNLFIDNNMDSSLSKYMLWVANYDNMPQKTDVWTQWTMWQYTGTGSIGGITGNVDLSYSTNGIFMDSPNSPTDTSVYSLVTDNSYKVSGTLKTFSATASFDGGTMMVVTTLSTGQQTTKYQLLSANDTTYPISVPKNAVRSAVYLIKGQFSGTSVPYTYGLTQFVTA